MKRSAAICCLFLVVLVTGCPRDEYVIDLQPRGNAIERKLLFYRADGVNSNGVPAYENFPTNELALIESLYSKENIKLDGFTRTANATFSNALPADVGGSGSYFCLSNSLGVAWGYMERFRGDDDFADHMARQSRQVDQFMELVLGWSRQEFGKEAHYKDLREFLDKDFRRDARNAAFYAWMLRASMTTGAQPKEEFAVRFGQYLIERGYLTSELLRIFASSIAPKNSQEQPRALGLIAQRVIASKLQIARDETMPQALKNLADPDLAGKSFTAYLETTDLYRERLRQWEEQRLKRSVAVAFDKSVGFLTANTNRPSRPGLPDKPDPDALTQEIGSAMFDLADIMETADHVVVRLSLPTAPAHTNGKWDETAKRVVWDFEVEGRTNALHLPLFCYANWSAVNKAFQIAHFGSVVVEDDDLGAYSLWRSGLNPTQAAEWEAFLAGLKPDPELRAKLAAFRFSTDDAGAPNKSAADSARKLIIENLPKDR